MPGPRSYTPPTLKKLFGLSGNECAFPGCTRQLVNQKTAVDSNICHIAGANEGSERYDENMSDKSRADYDNLILLCPPHHQETNDVDKYTPKVLLTMKSEHEALQLDQKLEDNPSMLFNTVKAVSMIDMEFDRTEEIEFPLHLFDPKEKIVFNELKDTSILINTYKVYYSKLDAVYSELEKDGSIIKQQLLEVIYMTYIDVKGRYIGDSDNSLSIVRQNSDAIFNEVFDSLHDSLRLFSALLSQKKMLIPIKTVEL